MGGRRSCLVLLVLLIPARAGASGHNFDACVAGSVIHVNPPKDPAQKDVSSSSVNELPPLTDPKVTGGHVAFAKAFHAGPTKKIAILADLSWNFLEKGKLKRPRELTQATIMFGPRWEFLKGKFTPMVHVLFGGRFGNQDIVGRTAVTAVGAALEYKLFGELTGSWGLKVGYDRLLFWNNKKPQDRISVGIVHRFPERYDP